MLSIIIHTSQFYHFLNKIKEAISQGIAEKQTLKDLAAQAKTETDGKQGTNT